MIARFSHAAEIGALLREFPVVAIVGARQTGKTTLAQAIGDRFGGAVHRFDLEDPRDDARLASPMLALEPLDGLVIIDEVQQRPDLFPVLRVLADRAGGAQHSDLERTSHWCGSQEKTADGHEGLSAVGLARLRFRNRLTCSGSF